MVLETVHAIGDTVRIVRAVKKYGESAEGLGDCTVTAVNVAATATDQRERYSVRCVVPPDPLNDRPEGRIMLYQLDVDVFGTI